MPAKTLNKIPNDDALTWYRALPVHRVQVHGSPVAYRVVGEGPALVFVHGWPLNAATWRYAARALSDRFTCYLPDLPGAGDSPLAAWQGEFFTSIGETLDAFVDALGLESYGLVGHDSGGGGARLHAARHPERVRALLMSNTEVPGHAPLLVRFLRALAFVPGMAVMFRALLGSSAYLRSNAGFGGCFVDKDLIEAEFADAALTPLRANIHGALDQVRRVDLAGSDAALSEAHALIHAPVRLVWGAWDRFFPLDGAERLAAELPGFEHMEVVERAKLFVHEEVPEVFNAQARAFFSAQLLDDEALARRSA